MSKKRDQITKFGQTNGRTYYSLYRVTEIKWLKDAHGALASLIPDTQNVCLDSQRKGGLLIEQIMTPEDSLSSVLCAAGVLYAVST